MLCLVQRSIVQLSSVFCQFKSAPLRSTLQGQLIAVSLKQTKSQASCKSRTIHFQMALLLTALLLFCIFNEAVF
jgi:hypothetical protein